MTPNTLPWASGFTKGNAIEVYCKATHKRIAQCSAKGAAGVEEIATAAFIARACNAHEALLEILMELHPTIKDDKIRAEVGAVIMRARGEA